MTRTPPSLSALLPLKITGRHYGENLARLDILLSSLQHFASPGTLDGYYVVTPRSELALVRQYVSHWSDLAIEVLDEDDAFPAFRTYQKPWQVRPWQRQQIIKLNASALVSSDFVLTLDPDVVALRPFDRELLLPEGRALLEPESRAVHRQWWLDSADLLDLPPHLERPGMGVTPALLSTEVLTRVQERLELVGGRPWMDVLLTSYSNWTEYTLYHLMAEDSGLLATHHTAGGAADTGVRLQVEAGASVWDAASATPETLRAMFSPEAAGVFGVVQSNTGLSAGIIARAAEARFPVRSTPTVPVPAAAGRSKLQERLRTALRLGASRLYRVRRAIRRARVTARRPTRSAER